MARLTKNKVKRQRAALERWKKAIACPLCINAAYVQTQIDALEKKLTKYTS